MEQSVPSFAPPAFEDDLERTHLQSIIDSKPEISREYTMPELLHKIDPSASLDPLAEEFLLDIADDFIDSVVSLAAEAAKNRKSETLQAVDVNYIIQRKFGADAADIRSLKDMQQEPDFVPNQAHQKRMKAIKETLQNE